jgi:ribosomal protein L37AE/L43A
MRNRPLKHNSTDNSVSLTGTRARKDFVSVPGVGLKNYDYFTPGPSQYIKPQAPQCPHCGMTAEPDRYRRLWWCHFCEREAPANYTPNAMIAPTTSTYMAAAISDPHALHVCHKCMSTMLPRIDNQGFDCPKCPDTTYHTPPRPRPGPII